MTITIESELLVLGFNVTDENFEVPKLKIIAKKVSRIG